MDADAANEGGAGRRGVRLLAVLLFVGWSCVLLAQAPGRDAYLVGQDHGFQLCLGRQVLFGKTPGVDTFNAYGPLVIYCSALGQWLSGSLIGETLLCCTGYAVALALIFLLVARHASVASGLLASVAGYLLLARFYKWYIWLLPLLALLALDRLLCAPERHRARRALVAGVVLGVGWLFRPDVGSVQAFLAGLLVLWVEGSRRRAALGRLAVGFALPLLAWFGFLFLHEGAGGVVYFLRSTFLGALMASDGMGRPFPRFDPAEPLSPQSVRIIGYAVLALSYGAGLALGAMRRDGGGAAQRRFLLAASLMGLGVVHQALHRKDGQHQLQVLAPAIVVVFVLGERLVRGVPGRRPGIGSGLAGLAYAILAIVAGAGLTRWSRVDLAAPKWWPAARFALLADPTATRGPHPVLTPLNRIRRKTDAHDSVLVYPLNPQYYVFLDRRMSGKLHAYYPGVFDRPPWSEDNLAAIEADPPAFVIVPGDFLDPPERPHRLQDNREAHAYLDEYLRHNYTLILARP